MNSLWEGCGGQEPEGSGFSWIEGESTRENNWNVGEGGQESKDKLEI